MCSSSPREVLCAPRSSRLSAAGASLAAMARKESEFVAQGSAVNCLSFGRKSGSVLCTGGDDKKVNVWALGKANAIMVRPWTHSAFYRRLQLIPETCLPRACVLGAPAEPRRAHERRGMREL